MWHYTKISHHASSLVYLLEGAQNQQLEQCDDEQRSKESRMNLGWSLNELFPKM